MGNLKQQAISPNYLLEGKLLFAMFMAMMLPTFEVFFVAHKLCI